MLDMGLKKIDGFPSFSCCSLRIQVLSLFLLHSYSVLTRHTVIIRCIGEILLFLWRWRSHLQFYIYDQFLHIFTSHTGINPNYVTLIILSAELRRQGTSVNTLELFPPVCIPTRWYTYVLVVSHSKINFIFCKSVLIDFRQIIIIFKKIWSCKQVIKTIITFWVYHY